MRFTKNQPIQLGATLLFGLAIGCAEWPRYQHKTTINSDSLSPNQSPQDALSIEWADIENSEESNNDPGDPLPIGIGHGIYTHGVLSGLGWSPDEVPDRQSTCGETRAFPPAAPGNYVGDIDWVSVEPQQNGTLCLTLTTDLETARLDVPLYVLDDCNEPVLVFVYPDTETPIGLDVPSSRAQWAISVSANTALGIGLAGFFPDDDELTANWEMNLSLAPSVGGAGNTLCPEDRQ